MPSGSILHEKPYVLCRAGTTGARAVTGMLFDIDDGFEATGSSEAAGIQTQAFKLLVGRVAFKIFDRFPELRESAKVIRVTE